MQIVEDTVVKFTLPTELVGYVTDYLEKSEVIETKGNLTEVAVYWGLKEMSHLASVLQFKEGYVPSPIARDYDWPGLYKPFDHQRTTASFLTLHRRAFCFNEAGTGKTSSVIWAADYLMRIGAIKRVLVLCPLSIMSSAWEADLFKFAMHRTCAIAHSYSKEKRISAIKSSAEFVILNFDGVEIVDEEQVDYIQSITPELLR